jgi:hypothetical protein
VGTHNVTATPTALPECLTLLLRNDSAETVYVGNASEQPHAVQPGASLSVPAPGDKQVYVRADNPVTIAYWITTD